MNNLLNKIFSVIGKPVASVVILVLISFSFVNAADEAFPEGRAPATGGNGGGILGESNTQGRSIAIGTEAVAVCPMCETPLDLGANTNPSLGTKHPTTGTQGVKSGK